MVFVLYLYGNQLINSPKCIVKPNNVVTMNLKITQSSTFFKIKGILDKSSIDVFHSEFKHIFERVNTLTISIEEVEWMDQDGVNAMAALHNEAILKNKKLSIIGLGCKDLYEHFKYQTAS